MVEESGGAEVATKLIELSDGILVEAEVSPDEATQIAGGAASRVESSLDRIEPVLLNVCKPISSVWNTITDLHVDHVEVEIGLSFEGEGNVFLTKAKAGANLTVTLSLSKRISADE
jgi:Trypsin-co-occurring domain 1